MTAIGIPSGRIRFPVVILAVALLSSPAAADVRLHRLFSDDMVLQRDA